MCNTNMVFGTLLLHVTGTSYTDLLIEMRGEMRDTFNLIFLSIVFKDFQFLMLIIYISTWYSAIIEMISHPFPHQQLISYCLS